MIKKISLVLAALTVVLLVAASSGTTFQDYGSTVRISAYDDIIELKFAPSVPDRKNLNSFARSLGYLAASDKIDIKVSPDLVNLVNNWNIGELKFRTNVDKLSFSGSGQFSDPSVSDLSYLDSDTAIVIGGALAEQAKFSNPELFNLLGDKTLCITYFENQPVLLLKGNIKNKQAYENYFADLRRSKFGSSTTDTVTYSESIIEEAKVKSISKAGSDLNVYETGDIALVVDNVKYLKKLIATKGKVTIQETTKFKDLYQSLNLGQNFKATSLFYSDLEKTLKNEPEQVERLVKSIIDMNLGADLGSSVDVKNIDSVLILTDEKSVKGVVKFK